MQTIFNLINIPFGWVLEFLSGIFGGNFAAAVFVFTLLINLLLIPLSIKSQKSSVQQTRIKPKLDELKKKYGDDKQKYSEAMQTLYREENVSMSGGCLPMILRLVLMMSIYYLILSPLTYMSHANATQVDNVTTAISESLTELQKSDEGKYKEIVEEISWKNGRNNQLSIVKIIREKPDVIKDLMSDEEYSKIEKDLAAVTKADKDADINYTFLGIDLTQTPKFSFDIFHDAQLIWVMPVLAFLAQMFTSALSLVMQKKINPDAPNMAGMMLTMPLMSLIIGFSLPGGVAFYWACSSLVGGFIQMGVQQFYGPHKMLSRERLKELNRECEFEEKQLKKAEHSALDGEENNN